MLYKPPSEQAVYLIPIGSIFNPLAEKFSGILDKELTGRKGHEKCACYWLVKQTLLIRTVQIWSEDNMVATPRLYGKTALLMDVKLYKWLK